MSFVASQNCVCKRSLQGTSSPDPTTVFVDMRALRHDRCANVINANSQMLTCWLRSCSTLLFFFSCFRVRLVERGSPHSLPLMESGKVSGNGSLSLLLLFCVCVCCVVVGGVQHSHPPSHWHLASWSQQLDFFLKSKQVELQKHLKWAEGWRPPSHAALMLSFIQTEAQKRYMVVVLFGGFWDTFIRISR